MSKYEKYRHLDTEYHYRKENGLIKVVCIYWNTYKCCNNFNKCEIKISCVDTVSWITYILNAHTHRDIELL